MFEDGFKLGIQSLIHKILSPFIIFKESIEKIIEWFTVIWHDRDWDQYYFYIVLKHKLDMMSKYQIKHGHSTESENISKQLAEARDLINKILNYDYIEEALKPFYKVYPDFELKMEFVPVNDGKGSNTVHFNLDDNPKQRELYNKYQVNAEVLENADKDKLFQMIRENIDGWWN